MKKEKQTNRMKGKMKTVKKATNSTNKLSKRLFASSLALFTLMAIGAPTPVRGEDPPKGARVLIELGRLSRLETPKDAEALKPGDMVVMACPKCKDIWVSYVESDAKGAKVLQSQGKPTKTVAKHQCPGCGSTFETGIEQGKGPKQAQIRHVCQKCGSKDAFCCVLKKEAVPTKGMEKEKQ